MFSILLSSECIKNAWCVFKWNVLNRKQDKAAMSLVLNYISIRRLCLDTQNKLCAESNVLNYTFTTSITYGTKMRREKTF